MTRLEAPPTALRAVHLFVLSSFAFAQPLFDLLGRTPEFFVARGSTAADVIVFAAGVVLLPPALLLVAELLVALVSRAASAALHLVFVALLVSLVALQALKRLDGAPAWVAVGAAVLIGAAAALVYRQARPLRTLVTVLLPAPLLFLVIFMSNSPIRKLALEEEAYAAAPVAEPAPIVFLVFDELPVVSLMDSQRRIDAVRYPAFASLAGDATWYRSATTVHEHTTHAVPAMLTGKLPRRGALPLAADHPENLFTLVGERYDLVVSERVTQLCPQRLCRREREPFGRRMRALSADLGVVYLHVLLPDRLTKRLPSVTETWQGFGDDHRGHAEPRVRPALGDDRDVDRMVGHELWRDQRFVFERFTTSVRPTGRPALYFLHVMLPHAPWRYLPSGRQYGDALSTEGLVRDVWSDDEWLVTQARQRHLLQVGFTDSLLGSLLSRLRKSGLYDRALIVVTADHGTSFRPADHRRHVTATNVHDIARVPLLVKLPAQRRGRVVDAHVTNVDILPTIADALEMRLPEPVDGLPLADGAGGAEVWVRGRAKAGVRSAVAAVERGLRASLAQKIAVFGERRRSLYAIGPNRALVGRTTASFRQRPARGARARVDGATLLAAVDPQAALVPARISGRVDGGAPRLQLAIAVNGRIAAVTRTFVEGDATRFFALVPEASFRAGANDVQVFAVARGGGRFVLERLTSTAAAAYELATAGGTTIRHDGREIPVVRGAVRGHVEDWFYERDSVRFGGWAADTENDRLPDAVLAFAGAKLVYVGATGVERTNLRVARENPDLERAGFVFELPQRLVPKGTRLRFFAVSGDSASELSYARGFPWRR